MTLVKDAATPRNLAEAIRRRFQAFGGVELRLPAREQMREPSRPTNNPSRTTGVSK